MNTCATSQCNYMYSVHVFIICNMTENCFLVLLITVIVHLNDTKSINSVHTFLLESNTYMGSVVWKSFAINMLT